MTNCDRTGLVPSLLATDLDAVASFYSELGFLRTGAFPEAGTPVWIEMTRGDATMQFYSDPPIGTPDQPVCSGTFYVYTRDVARFAEDLRGKVEFAWGPQETEYGMREVAVRDPAGYLVAFTEPV